MASSIQQGFEKYLRARARQDQAKQEQARKQQQQNGVSCPFCSDVLDDRLELFSEHIQADHPTRDEDLDDSGRAELFRSAPRVPRPAKNVLPPHAPSTSTTRAKRSRSRDLDLPSTPGTNLDTNYPDTTYQADDDSPQPNKRINSPDPSLGRAQSSSPPLSRRSRARPEDPSKDFDRGPGYGSRPQISRLFNPKEDNSTFKSQGRPSESQRPRHHHHQPRGHKPSHLAPNAYAPRPHVDGADDPGGGFLKEPETRPITQEQLVAEVKGIYAGLVMVESKCIEVDSAQSSNTDAKLNPEQWQALSALHRTLLHEHHDFFLASQHPSASQALRRLAAKYAMPARMWRHGIHSFLELLRHRLPGSLEHMLTFIYLAYSMMALLYETVPAFEETWIECLGDLGRYRMAIADDNLRDREVWTSVSRLWYSKASDMSPTVGRLFHHLAILARPFPLQQQFYYLKSLCVPTPFLSARESVMTLYDPVLNATTTRMEPVDAACIRALGVLFSGKCPEKFEPSKQEFLSLLDGRIAKTTRRWIEPGYHISVSLLCAVIGFGDSQNVLMKVIKPSRAEEAQDVPMDGTATEVTSPSGAFEDALLLFVATCKVVLRRFGDPSVLSFFHVTLAFIANMAKRKTAMSHLERALPWRLISVVLNILSDSHENYARFEAMDFPRPEKKDASSRPLPEDFAQRGLLWTEGYFPMDWFKDHKLDDDEKYMELLSMTDERTERCLWLGHQITKLGDWLRYDDTTHQFSVAEPYWEDIDTLPLPTPAEADPEAAPPSEALPAAETTVAEGSVAPPADDEVMADASQPA